MGIVHERGMMALGSALDFMRRMFDMILMHKVYSILYSFSSFVTSRWALQRRSQYRNTWYRSAYLTYSRNGCDSDARTCSKPLATAHPKPVGFKLDLLAIYVCAIAESK